MSRREEWLGILGGGQLGRMFVMAAQTLGYRVMVLDPDADCPAGRSADRFLCGAYDAPDLLAVMVAQCAAVTIEFEGVPAESLAWLSMRCKVTPSAASVATAQDRIAEKKLLATVVGVVPYAVIENVHDLAAVTPDLFPGILKTARMGYDGRGQATVADAAALAAAYERFGGVPCILEKRIRFVRELSVVLARSRAGRLAVYPVVENRHVDGILDVSIAPAQVAADTALRARAAAIAVAEALDYHGVMCLELFELEDGRLFANEIAPRPHNSGHWTLDAASHSQFEQQVRVIAGLPLADPQQRAPAVMVNLLGELWRDGEPDWACLLGDAQTRLWLYGKAGARGGRKMGHFTCIDTDVVTALRRAEGLRQRLASMTPRATSQARQPEPRAAALPLY
jgi:5-(carboxyamino)imidazole ribonucleotide synthase